MAAKPDMSDAWAESGSVTNPGAVKIVLGWIAEIPTFQIFNWILNRIDTFLQHINERGVAEWDNATVYVEGAKVIGSDDAHYYLPSGGGTSTNEDPISGSPWITEVSGQTNDWQSGQVINEKTLSYAASTVWDVAVLQNAEITLTGNLTFTAFNNPKAGGIYLLAVKQDATAGRAITWPANVKWPNGITPVLSGTSNETDIISFYYNGTSFLASQNGHYPL